MKKFSIKHLVACGALLIAGQAIADVSSDEAALLKQGEYLSRVGDCMACHSVAGKPAYSGGYAIKSGLGTIYSTNITPDKTYGIGRYTEKQFADAVRRGVRGDGAFLYPAMPYPDYAKITDEDMHALYTWFMKGVKPSAVQPPKTDLSFPFSQRWGMRFWNWAFTDNKPFRAPDKVTEQVARGAYLVEGLGHCGSCHTPRGLSMNEKGLDSSDSHFLAGADLNGWPVPSLRGLPRFTQQQIVDYLQTGRSSKAAVAGEMNMVVVNSTSHMTESDLQAVAAYLKHLGGNPAMPQQDEAKAQVTIDKLTTAKNLTEGERLYIDNCGACHFVTGKGAPPAFPPLDGASVVNAKEPGGLVQVILQGAQLPSTPVAPSALAMPGFANRLSDDEVASLATFIRQGWNNNASAVDAAQVKTVRNKLAADK